MASQIHLPHDCLLNSRAQIKENIKFRVIEMTIRYPIASNTQMMQIISQSLFWYEVYMGQVTKVTLSCYKVLLSTDR